MGRHYKNEIFIIKIHYCRHYKNLEYALKDMAFCHLLKMLVINMVKKLMDTAAKTGIDAAKTASKRVVQKTADAAGDLIGNKIADKITFIDKSKEKEKINKVEEIYILPEKSEQSIDELKLFWA